MTAQNSKLKFFWDNVLTNTGSSLSADSTSSTSDYSVNYLTNNLEVNSWMEQATGLSTTRNIHFDGGVGNAYGADYLIIHGHNLNGATVALQASTDDFVSTTTAVTFTVGTTGTIMSTFTNPGTFRYWRLQFSKSTATQASIQILSFGTLTELDHISAPFDPYSQEASANVNLSQGGFVSGIHTKYINRSLSITLSNQSTVVYSGLNSWWENNGVGNFFMAWDSTGSTADVWLVRPDMRYSNPINENHYRDITMNLTGRKV